MSAKAKFLEILGGVYDFYGRELSAFSAQVWLQACESFDVEQVSKALSAHLMDPERGQFMPKPADIVRQLQGTNTDRSLVAWGKALDAMQRVGAYESVAFDDGIIHTVIEDLGGWSKLCRSNMDELQFVQKRFCDSYKAYASRPGHEHPSYLPGAHEIENRMNGRKTQKPVLIGSPEKAAEVMRLGVDGSKTKITRASESLRLVHAREKGAA